MTNERDRHAAIEMPTDSSDGAGAHADDDGLVIQPGMLLCDRFELIHCIEHSPDGSLYIARDSSRGDRPVGIQLLTAAPANDLDAHVERIEKAFGQALLLEHPNIVQIDALYEHRGAWFVTMEGLAGEPMSRMLRHLDRPLSPNESTTFLRAMASALAYAHQHGVAHGCFGSHNVLVTSSVDVRVINFAYLAAADPARQRVVSAEQDRWALACVLYEMLSGQPPFGGMSFERVLRHGVQPGRIHGITRARWELLARALSPGRVRNVPSFDELLAAFGTPVEDDDPLPTETSAQVDTRPGPAVPPSAPPATGSGTAVAASTTRAAAPVAAPGSGDAASGTTAVSHSSTASSDADTALVQDATSAGLHTPPMPIAGSTPTPDIDFDAIKDVSQPSEDITTPFDIPVLTTRLTPPLAASGAVDADASMTATASSEPVTQPEPRERRGPGALAWVVGALVVVAGASAYLLQDAWRPLLETGADPAPLERGTPLVEAPASVPSDTADDTATVRTSVDEAVDANDPASADETVDPSAAATARNALTPALVEALRHSVAQAADADAGSDLTDRANERAALETEPAAPEVAATVPAPAADAGGDSSVATAAETRAGVGTDRPAPTPGGGDRPVESDAQRPVSASDSESVAVVRVTPRATEPVEAPMPTTDPAPGVPIGSEPSVAAQARTPAPPAAAKSGDDDPMHVVPTRPVDGETAVAFGEPDAIQMTAATNAAMQPTGKSTSTATVPGAQSMESASRPVPTGEPGVLRLSPAADFVSEGDGFFRLVIERTGGTAGTATLTWWTEPGSASADDDYADLGTRTEQFADGETYRQIFLPIASDEVRENHEFLYLLQEDPTGHITRETLTIQDDD